MIDSAHNWRRLAPLIFATTLVPAACLFWLGWKVVKEDRVLRENHAKEQREQAADLATSSLRRVVAEAEERLATFSAALATSGHDPSDGVALIAFGRKGVIKHAGTPLLYYPALPTTEEPDPAGIAAVDDLEFQKQDLSGALQVLEAMTRSRQPVVVGSAQLRIAASEKKLGNTSRALDAFTQLGKLGEVRVQGVPAGLIAHQGRALIFQSTGRRDELQHEAAAICDELESGRWMLSHGEFEFFYNQQARQWLTQQRPPISADMIALADTAESLWREWQVPGNPPQNGRSRRTLHSGEIPILLLTRSTPEQQSALLMTPRFLETVWLDGLQSVERARLVDFDFALTDADDRPFLGQPGAPLSMQAVRPASGPLPWAVHAISKINGPMPGLSNQTKLSLAGIIVMALVALAGGYFINRSILRELRVARLQSDFVAAVSHEFRSPVTTFRQLAEMLVNGRVSSDARRQLIYVTLLRESDRLHRLVEGLLNFGRMEAGELRYRFEQVDPESFMREIVTEFEHEVSGRGYHVELQGGPQLPRIRADRESLSRVFWNLLDNAVKYSPENRTVWVDLSDAGRQLAVRVRDRGIGIPAPEQKEIFKKFVRGAAPKTASIQGTGVGLAMARQIVTAHGGDISVESKPGEGSVFTVLLPVAET